MVKRQPLVSVIIPVYNRAEGVLRAVNSVLSQSIKDLELIVVDDGSRDNTLKKLAALQDKRLTVISQSNQGVSVARNKGIAHANSQWIAFLDSDDVWLPFKLEKQFQAIEKNNYLWYHGGEIWIRKGVRVNAHKKHEKQGGRIYLASLPLCVVSPSTVMIHRNIFNEVGVFDPLLPAAEDYDLWLRISSRHEIGYIPENLIEKYGGHEGQLSRTFLGLDRFRVRALKKQLNSLYLNQSEKEETKKLYREKSRILAEGFKKHGKQLISDYYYQLLKSID